VEAIEPVWLFGVIALAAGVFLGMLITRLINPASADVDKLKSELEQARTEMAQYRASVDSHFNKTSELVSELTQDYVKVYRHLAEGAETLSDIREFSQVLEQSRGRVLITVDGETSAAEPAGEAEAAATDAVEPNAAKESRGEADRPGEQETAAERESEVSAPADYAAGQDAEETAKAAAPEESMTDESAKKKSEAPAGGDAEQPEQGSGRDAAAKEGETDSAKKAPA
jgi:uncharacterized membrane-anchored protein YhcB (DUF1043 family)